MKIKLLILSLSVCLITSCGKNACFECTKPNSTRGLCGEDARQFKKDMEKQGYTCTKVSNGN